MTDPRDHDGDEDGSANGWSSVASALKRSPRAGRASAAGWGRLADKLPRPEDKAAADDTGPAPRPVDERPPAGSEPGVSLAKEDRAADEDPSPSSDLDPVGDSPNGRHRPPRLPRTRRAAAAVLAAVTVAALVVIGLVVWPGIGGGLPGNVALRVDGKNITKAELADNITVLTKYYGYQNPGNGEAAKAYAIDQIIRDRAAAMKITVTDKQADNGVSTTEISALAASRGLTLAQVQSQLHLNALEQALLAKVTGTVNPTQAQITQVYNANTKSLAVPETRAVSRILTSDLPTAQNVMTQLQGGASFATLASQDSQDTATKGNGGVIGTVPEAAISSQAFATAAFAAPLNAPFGPVSEGQSGGYDVGVVTAINAGAPATLDDRTQGVIKAYLTGQVRSQRWRTFLGRQLTAANVRYKSGYRPADPDSPPPYPAPSLSSLMASAVTQLASSSPTSGATP